MTKSEAVKELLRIARKLVDELDRIALENVIAWIAGDGEEPPNRRGGSAERMRRKRERDASQRASQPPSQGVTNPVTSDAKKASQVASRLALPVAGVSDSGSGFGLPPGVLHIPDSSSDSGPSELQDLTLETSPKAGAPVALRVVRPRKSDSTLVVTSDVTHGVTNAVTRRVTKSVTPSASQAANAATWDAYSAAYDARYRVEPVRNARVNGQIAQFVKRVPADEAPFIAAAYVRSQNARYVAAGHSVGCLLQDAEKLRTEALTGRGGTLSAARKTDHTAARADEYADMFARLAAKDADDAAKGITHG